MIDVSISLKTDLMNCSELIVKVPQLRNGILEMPFLNGTRTKPGE